MPEIDPPGAAQAAPPSVEAPHGEALVAADRQEPSTPASRPLLMDYLETLIVAVLLVLFVTTFMVQNSVIPTASMEDTLLIGDYLLVNKIAFSPADAASPAAWMAQREIRRGDVIVFKFPKDPKVDYIKRVVGLPGDTIEVRDKRLWRNGEPTDDPHAVHKTGIIEPAEEGEFHRDNFGPVVVPEGSYFAMGDNRDYSADSREWGFVPRENITGRAFLIFWSRVQKPGSWQSSAFARVKIFLRSLRDLPSETRWSRICTLVR